MIYKAINRENKSLEGLEKNIDYNYNPDKTSDLKYTYGLNVSSDSNQMFKEFLQVKEEFNKLDGRQHLHFVMSFKDNISPEMALEIGKEFLAHPKFEKFQVGLATHLDTDNIHNHIIINSVSFVDGKKWQQSKKELKNLKAYLRGICNERGVDLEESEDKTLKYYKDKPEINDAIKIYSELKDNSKNFKELELRLREKGLILNEGYPEILGSKFYEKKRLFDNIKNTLSSSTSREEFVKSLENKGYKVNFYDNRKYVTFTVYPDSKKPLKFRDKNFKHRGEVFSKEYFEDVFKKNGVRLLGNEVNYKNIPKESFKKKEKMAFAREENSKDDLKASDISFSSDKNKKDNKDTKLYLVTKNNYVVNIKKIDKDFTKKRLDFYFKEKGNVFEKESIIRSIFGLTRGEERSDEEINLTTIRSKAESKENER